MTVSIVNKHTGDRFPLEVAAEADFHKLKDQISTRIGLEPSEFRIGFNGKSMDAEPWRSVREFYGLSMVDGKECVFVLVAPALGGVAGVKGHRQEGAADGAQEEVR